jgi:ElaA protein
MTLRWSWRTFPELTIDELYQALRLRQEVFIVEQKCLYVDLDGLDQSCWHGLGYESDGNLGAYARILPRGSSSRDQP